MVSKNTYEELFQILSLMDKSSVMKIPIDTLTMIKNNRNPDYETKIDKNDLFNEKNVSKETIDILCYFDYHYWINSEKKFEIEKIRKQKNVELEEIKKKKYNPDDIFKNRNINNNEKAQKTLKLEVQKQNIFRRLLNFIKKLINF